MYDFEGTGLEQGGLKFRLFPCEFGRHDPQTMLYLGRRSESQNCHGPGQDFLGMCRKGVVVA